MSEERAALGALAAAKKFAPLPDTPVNHQAVRHVGTKDEEGQAQLGILIMHGCKPEHTVLEIGCGALNAGYPIMQYLNAGNYVGIDPNFWTIENSLKVPEVKAVADARKARFGASAEFDAASFGTKFDYVISHSVLSHAAHWQWPQFLKNVDAVLKPGGMILASLHFTEGNAYGDAGYGGTELDFNEWVYPGASYFRKETIFNLAKQYGYTARIDVAAAIIITRVHPASHHTWLVLQKH